MSALFFIPHQEYYIIMWKKWQINDLNRAGVWKVGGELIGISVFTLIPYLVALSKYGHGSDHRNL